ncbi:heavy metal translocating P-type ATPase [Rothia kristinae]|uniref:heavy metal translocating P-type ATPase n=1 Tax=Rothia kristinae TaxID=37923 RepID=UPI001CD65A75|nr:heavy metal translocating P-type ATPase [Rothia kristinae]MCA1169851.1 heavy metal translocating P-type ATPase [Rothia kristinae]
MSTEESTHHRDAGSDPHAGHDEHAGGESHSQHRDQHNGGHGHSGHGGHDQHAGHDHHGGHSGHGGGHMQHHVMMFRRLFWIMLVLAVPVSVFSHGFAHLLGYSLPDAEWVRWIAPVLGTVMYVWGGKPFLSGAVSEIRSKSPGMMLLISLGITVAFLSSWGATLHLLDSGLEFWWELALLVVIMLLGHWIEMRSLAQTSSALDSLAALLPDEAEKVEGENVVTVSPDELAVDDVVLVRPGSSVPADGTILEGAAAMDESMVTGESRTVRRGKGEHVVAGTIATDSGLRVQITATGEDTALAGIRRLVDDAQSSSTRAQLLADRAAAWLFWFALGAAVITAIVWFALGRPDDAVVRTVSVLVIACPHALGLAIPLVVSLATERAAKAGVLISNRSALEAMRRVDTVFFDKTGTLTRGEPAVTAVDPAEGREEESVLGLAAAAEQDSEHPLARAILAAARKRSVRLPQAQDFTSSPAVGVSASVDGATVEVGGPRLLEQHDLEELPQASSWRDEGAIILHVVVDGTVAGALRLADEVRPESREAVEALHAAGVQVAMITGDAEAVAQDVAGKLGIDRVFAGVRPEDKSAKVEQVQGEGRRVAMVGDGVNDAPALARADVGLAIGAGTDVAIGSAGVVLASSDPRSVLSVIELSRASYRKMRQNLWWAAGYNLVSVPLAAGVLAPVGFLMPMSVGALLMSASTVVVAANAQLLRRLDLSPEASAQRILQRRGADRTEAQEVQHRHGTA